MTLGACLVRASRVLEWEREWIILILIVRLESYFHFNSRRKWKYLNSLKFNPYVFSAFNSILILITNQIYQGISLFWFSFQSILILVTNQIHPRLIVHEETCLILSRSLPSLSYVWHPKFEGKKVFRRKMMMTIFKSLAKWSPIRQFSCKFSEVICMPLYYEHTL